MPVLKLSLTEEEYKELQALADAEKMTIQDLIRYRLLQKRNPSIFEPEEAVRRALEKYSPEDEPFTLPDIYGEQWTELNPRMTGVFGKRFFNYLKTNDAIEFAGMTPNGRRATYKVRGGKFMKLQESEKRLVEREIVKAMMKNPSIERKNLISKVMEKVSPKIKDITRNNVSGMLSLVMAEYNF